MRYRSVREFLAQEGEDAPTPAERALIEACQKGRRCTLGDGTLPPEDCTDPTRIVRAELLRLLVIGGTAECGLDESGVWLVGGYLTGWLNLQHVTGRGRCFLHTCRFAARPNLANATLPEVSLDGSTLPGLYAQGLKVKGNLFLTKLTATGTVDVNGADIGGQLSCDGATFDGAGGKALNAQGVRTGADLFLRKLTATGTVAVNGADIGGQLECDGATFDGAGGEALNAQGVRTGASLFLSKLTATGTVEVNGADIGGQLSCVGATLDGAGGMALRAERMVVKAGFFWRLVTGVKGPVDLAFAQVGELVDDAASWNLVEGEIDLDGFTYGRIASNSPMTFDARRDWLARGSSFGGHFTPQPYTQFAKILRESGHQAEARRVLLVRERAVARAARRAMIVVPNGGAGRRLLSLWADLKRGAHWSWHRALDLGAGYGYAPGRSVLALCGLILTAYLLASAAWNEGAFAPSSDVILTSTDWTGLVARDCVPDPTPGCVQNPAETWSGFDHQGLDWDTFQPAAYAADLVVPILTLGQTDAWAPSRDRGTWGEILWWARWFLIGFGWLVTAMGVAAITGLMQRNQSD